MKLRGIEFGRVQNASGARGFFGETSSFKWPVNNPANWQGSTFVAKTVTLRKQIGNMPMQKDGITPQEKKPSCIYIDKENNLTVNAVGLSGPGIRPLLSDGHWQKLNEPFFLSFMSINKTPAERLRELNDFVKILKKELPKFKSPIGLQINFSCPNNGLNLSRIVDEVDDSLNIAAELEVPLVPKFNVFLPLKAAHIITKNCFCDGIYVSNTLPWHDIYKSKSPLDHLGGGGVGGKPLLEKVTAWIKKADLKKPVVGGGGILSVDDAKSVFKAGASAIALGSVSVLKPQNVQKIIAYAKNYHN